MEATVTMPLTMYDDLRDEIERLSERVAQLVYINDYHKDIVSKKEASIGALQDYVMKRAFYEHELGRKSLDELLETWYGEKRLKCMSSDLYDNKFGITLEIQRDYVTRRYNEYQAQEQQEAEDEQPSIKEAE